MRGPVRSRSAGYQGGTHAREQARLRAREPALHARRARRALSRKCDKILHQKAPRALGRGKGDVRDVRRENFLSAKNKIHYVKVRFMRAI